MNLQMAKSIKNILLNALYCFLYNMYNIFLVISLYFKSLFYSHDMKSVFSKSKLIREKNRKERKNREKKKKRSIGLFRLTLSAWSGATTRRLGRVMAMRAWYRKQRPKKKKKIYWSSSVNPFRLVWNTH